MSARTIDRRLATGVWDLLYPAVYRVAGSLPSRHQSLLAACLAWGDGAAVSHIPAAALWELPRFQSRVIELSVPRGRRRAHGGRVHRPRSWTPVDVTELDAIPVTTVARTLIDVAACVSAELVEEALDDALRRKLVTVPGLHRRLLQIGGHGRRGSGVIADLIAARAGRGEVPQSVFETRLLRVLRRARLPMPAVQHEVRTRYGPAVLDFAYVDRRLAIEADGFRWHSSRRQWDHDRARSNALTMLGWTVIRVTWVELHEHPGEVIEAIRASFSRSSPRREGP